MLLNKLGYVLYLNVPKVGISKIKKKKKKKAKIMLAGVKTIPLMINTAMLQKLGTCLEENGSF